MEIDIKNYLTDEDLRDLAMDVVRDKFRAVFQNEKEINRIITNLGYEFVFKAVCDAFGKSREELEKKLINGIYEALDSDHIRFQVFRRKDVWHTDESPAVKILDEVLRESKPRIEAEVNRRISEYPFRELEDEITDTIYECICRKFREVGE